jgi:hypothetical protein
MKLISSYRIIRQAWQNANGCDTVEVTYEDGSIGELPLHPSTHWWNDDSFKSAEALPSRVS